MNTIAINLVIPLNGLTNNIPTNKTTKAHIIQDAGVILITSPLLTIISLLFPLNCLICNVALSCGKSITLSSPLSIFPTLSPSTYSFSFNKLA